MSVGHSLRAAREDAGLTVADVADRTRIRATVISAMERDEFALCGGDIYARGHVRSISAAIGVEAGPFVAEFDRDHAVEAPMASRVFEAETTTRRERRGPNWSAVMATALVAAVAFLGVQLVTGGGEAPRGTTTVADPTPTPTPTPTGSDTPSAEPTDSPVEVVPTDEVVVQVTAVAGGVSWVQVTDSKGTVRFTGNLADGQARTFRDKTPPALILGNASGVVLVVNGSDVGSPGNQAEVVKLTFRPGDPDGSAG